MSLAASSGWVADAPSPSLLGRHCSRFAVAGITVELQGETARAVDLGPQLLPFASDSESHEDITVQIEWSSAIRSPWGRELFHSGCLWSVHQFGDGYLFDFTTGHLGRRPYKRLLVDWDFRQARVILNRECLTEEDAGRALEYPLDELLITHHLSLSGGVELHGCGMMREDGESFLLVGHSGAGKSTTARLWSEHLPVEVFSDDRIVVRRLGDLGQGALGQGRDIGLTAAQVKGVGQERPTYIPKFLMHGTPWHGEAAFASPGRTAVHRIFILEHGKENRVEALSRSAAVGELLARSFTPFYQARFVDPVLALLEELVESLPCYRFHFVPDSTAVEKILEFRD
jgi:hypothetical protein